MTWCIDGLASNPNIEDGSQKEFIFCCFVSPHWIQASINSTYSVGRISQDISSTSEWLCIHMYVHHFISWLD